MNTQPVVLYVEDDPGSREIMSIILVEMMGLQNVTIFSESSNFIDRLQALSPQPDIILLDIHVPPYSGFQMLKMIRSDARFDHIPVVALTASVMNEEIDDLKAAGFVGVVAKPVDMDTFPQVLGQIVSGETVWSIVGDKVS